MNSKSAEAFIHSLRSADTVPYIQYWNNLIPKTEREHWQRWVFAFTSVRTSWRNNVKGYLAVNDLGLIFSEQKLRDAIVASGIGLHQMRVKGIWDFNASFWNDPDWFRPQTGESMVSCRDRLAKKLYGIGLAKTSFVFEMVYPVSCGVVCLDTHILQLYGLKDTPGKKVYHKAEDHWRTTCHKQGIPPAIARHIYWDRLQGHNLNRYWAWCLERRPSASAEQKGETHTPRDPWVPSQVRAA